MCQAGHVLVQLNRLAVSTSEGSQSVDYLSWPSRLGLAPLQLNQQVALIDRKRCENTFRFVSSTFIDFATLPMLPYSSLLCSAKARHVIK